MSSVGSIVCRRSFLFPPLVFLFFFVVSSAALAAENDGVRTALSARHLSASPEQLERIAGGEEPLVRELLVLRATKVPPYLALRAEKMLLRYSDREEVLTALEQDLANPDRRGLAQLIAIHIDDIAPETSRRRIGEAIVERAKRDEAYSPFARMLAESKDPVVRQLLLPQ